MSKELQKTPRTFEEILSSANEQTSQYNSQIPRGELDSILQNNITALKSLNNIISGFKDTKIPNIITSDLEVVTPSISLIPDIGKFLFTSTVKAVWNGASSVDTLRIFYKSDL